MRHQPDVVVGLYTFVGVSGVFSFGHAAFMAIGAYTGAILVIPPETKKFVLPDLPGFLASAQLDPLPATLVAGALAAAFALVLSLPLARLSGPHRGARDVRRAQHRQHRRAQLGAGHARHGRCLRDSDDDDDLGSARLGHAAAMAAAWAFQRSRIGLRLRASREDESRRALDRCRRRP